jgi:hypothetical protein
MRSDRWRTGSSSGSTTTTTASDVRGLLGSSMLRRAGWLLHTS